MHASAADELIQTPGALAGQLGEGYMKIVNWILLAMVMMIVYPVCGMVWLWERATGKRFELEQPKIRHHGTWMSLTYGPMADSPPGNAPGPKS
jgi:hypothetical protein